MSHQRLTRNALLAVAQVVVSGIVLLVMYGYLIRVIGLEQLGIWAIVLATASVSKISELGFTGSAVKFTAKYVALGDRAKVADVMQTTVITVGAALMVVLTAGYPVIAILMKLVIPVEHILLALNILPYVLVSLWVSSVAGVFLSGLDGCQRIDLRAIVVMFSAILFLILTIILTPIYGLLGLAWAQIVQGVATLFAARILLQREIPSLPLLALKWRGELFREMFQYGVNFQVISIMIILFDPVTKILLALFGGLTSTAYYEMGNRMVSQFRALIASANQVVVPKVAALQENNPKEVEGIYLYSYKIVFFLALPLYLGMIVALPLISEVWIGRFEEEFVWYSVLLALGYWLNTLVGPAYFVNLGTGRLRWNTWAHIVIAVLNLTLGYAFGIIFGGVGVVFGYVLALTIGSSLIILSYHRDNSIAFATLFPRESLLLFIVCCFGLLLGFSAVYLMQDVFSGFSKYWLAPLMFMMVVVLPCWVHPMRVKISSKIYIVLKPKT